MPLPACYLPPSGLPGLEQPEAPRCEPAQPHSGGPGRHLPAAPQAEAASGGSEPGAGPGIHGTCTKGRRAGEQRLQDLLFEGLFDRVCLECVLAGQPHQSVTPLSGFQCFSAPLFACCSLPHPPSSPLDCPLPSHFAWQDVSRFLQAYRHLPREPPSGTAGRSEGRQDETLEACVEVLGSRMLRGTLAGAEVRRQRSGRVP